MMKSLKIGFQLFPVDIIELTFYNSSMKHMFDMEEGRYGQSDHSRGYE